MDKIPYGTKYTFDNLPFIFPDADIRTGKGFPDLYLDEKDDTARALIILGRRFLAEGYEMSSIIRYAASGNQVFISALSLSDTALNMLNLKTDQSYQEEGDHTEMSILNPASREWEKFSYPGLSRDPYFKVIDTGHATILGRDFRGRPDFIRIPYAHGGAIFIHLNPVAFSNFFLLHKQNKSYYDIAFSYMREKTAVVEWTEYFRYAQPENFSALRFILGSRSLRWAFWITLLLFLLLFLVESKRKQRPVPEIPVLKNASEDFVKTVGRLYFQQKNNQNLAAKMIAAFLENIRTNYNLQTSELNDEFAQKLAFRTGRPLNEITQLVELIHASRINTDLSDFELMDLHQQVNQFNKPV
jgi:hypothetical protein